MSLLKTKTTYKNIIIEVSQPVDLYFIIVVNAFGTHLKLTKHCSDINKKVWAGFLMGVEFLEFERQSGICCKMAIRGENCEIWWVDEFNYEFQLSIPKKGIVIALQRIYEPTR